MWPHFGNLLGRSWAAFISAIGSTTLGFIAPFMVPFVGFALVLVVALGREGRKAVGEHVRRTLTTAALVGIIGELIVYGSIFGWSVVKTIYEDHQGLVATNHTLNAKLEEKVSNGNASATNQPSSTDTTERHLASLVTALDKIAKPLAEAQARPPTSLKKRTLEMSNAILSFLIERSKNEPLVPQTTATQATRDEYEQKQKAFEKETLTLFYANFAPRVMVIADDLRASGIEKADYIKGYAQGANLTAHLRELGVTLGQVGEKMP